MGRSLPLGDDSLVHPTVSLSLLVVGMAATIALITGLCGFRKKPSPDLSSSPAAQVADRSDADATETTLMVPPPPQTTTTGLETENATDTKELPLPPARKALRETYSCNYKADSASSRKLNSTMSMKVPRSLSVSKAREEKPSQRKKGKLKAEDSIWTKTIILGEKCKVPDDEDGAVLYDGKGQRISTYHPRTLSALPLSRTSSFIDQNAIPSQDKDKGTSSKEDGDS